MEPKYFNHLDFVGKYNSIQGDSKKLLDRLGLWEEYGQTGWGDDGSERIFAHVPRLNKTILTHYYSYTDGVEDVSRPLFDTDYGLRRFGMSREWANHGAWKKGRKWKRKMRIISPFLKNAKGKKKSVDTASEKEGERGVWNFTN